MFSASMTNGVDIAAVTNALYKRIGWRQSTIAGGPVPNSDAAASTSGRYYNDAHALCTLPNVKAAVIDNPAASDAQLNTELANMDKAVIAGAIGQVFTAPEYHESGLLYDRCGQHLETIANGNAFCGWQFTLPSESDKALVLLTAQLLFSDAATFKLYLFREGKKAPLKEWEVTTVAEEVTEINLGNELVKYGGGTIAKRFWIGYFQRDLATTKAMGEDATLNKTLCFGATPYQSAQIGETLDFERERYNLVTKPMGLNIKYAVVSDWTERLTRRPELFDNLRMLLMAAHVLQRIIYSKRINGDKSMLLEGIALANVVAELQGSAPVSDGPPPIEGLGKKIQKEAERVRVQFFGKQVTSSIVNALNEVYAHY